MPCAVQRAIAASPLGRCETSHRHSRPSLDEMSRDLSCGTLVNQSPRVNFAKFDCVHDRCARFTHTWHFGFASPKS